MKNKAYECYVAALLQRFKKAENAAVDISFEELGKTVDLTAESTRHSWGFCELVAEFDSLTDFCEVFQPQSVADLEKIGLKELETLYQNGQAFICAYIMQDNNRPPLYVNFWCYRQQLIAECENHFVEVPDAYRTPDTWKAFSQEFFPAQFPQVWPLLQ